ncbi:MAG: hypothetical protein QOI54_3318 [Actinomycetota bacterium]|nr:hypothetical protein [Actinomycetota bacterium]
MTPSERVGYANKARSLKFRREIISYLNAHGFPDVVSAPEPLGMSVAERLREKRGDLLGLEPWVVSVRARETTFDLSEGMDRVRWIAENAASPFWCLIQMRRQRPDLDQATVVMSLAVFTRVLLLLEQLRATDEEHS